MKKRFSIIITLFLACIMFIPNIYAGTTYGKVTDIKNTDSSNKEGSDNPTITGNETSKVVITYSTVGLKILEGTDSSNGNRPAGYAWLGFHIDKPTGVTASSGKAKYRVNEGESEEYTDGDYYFGINKDKLITAIKQNKNIQYVYEFDWDNNGEYEQTVIAIVEPSKVTLTENGLTLWTPADVNKYKEVTTVPKTGESIPYVLFGILSIIGISASYSLKLYRK